MKRNSIFVSIFIMICLYFSSPALSKEPDGPEYEKNCTITGVDGPMISTSCQPFVFGEEVKITDDSGRSLYLSQIPLPSEALIKYTCDANETCNMVTSIRLYERIKEIPE